MNTISQEMWDQVFIDRGIHASRHYASSVPPLSQEAAGTLWRRVVESADNADEFSVALTALGAFRAFGFETPPYAATIEQYRDDSCDNCILYVGHVDAEDFAEVDLQDERAEDAYVEVGHRLMDYFPYCDKVEVPYLTDMVKAEQYLYTPDERLVMPDLELHHSNWPYVDQIEIFRDLFIRPIEKRAGHSLPDLRKHARSTMKLARMAVTN